MSEYVMVEREWLVSLLMKAYNAISETGAIEILSDHSKVQSVLSGIAAAKEGATNPLTPPEQ